MATHSSVLAWRISGTGEPDGLPSMGSHRVGHDWSDLAAAAAVVINRLSVIICQIFYIVFHKLQLVLTANSSLLQKFCFILLWSLPTARVWYFLNIVLRKTEFNFPFPIFRSEWDSWLCTQMEDSLINFSSVILKYLQGIAWLLFSCLLWVVRKQQVTCLHCGYFPVGNAFGDQLGRFFQTADDTVNYDWHSCHSPQSWTWRKSIWVRLYFNKVCASKNITCSPRPLPRTSFGQIVQTWNVVSCPVKYKLAHAIGTCHLPTRM